MNIRGVRLFETRTNVACNKIGVATAARQGPRPFWKMRGLIWLIVMLVNSTLSATVLEDQRLILLRTEQGAVLKCYICSDIGASTIKNTTNCFVAVHTKICQY